jgi:hypothetical protein
VADGTATATAEAQAEVDAAETAAAHALVGASWLTPASAAADAAADDDPEEEEEALVLRARRNIAAGSEVTLDYGARSNAELLATHGFALHPNRHEALPIELAISDDLDPLATLKQRLLAAGNVGCHGSHTQCPPSLPASGARCTVPALRLCAAPTLPRHPVLSAR